MRFSFQIAAVLCIGFGASLAAEENIQPIHQLEDITVTGTGAEKRLKDSPVATEVITAEEIGNSGAATVGDVLDDYGLMYWSGAMGDYVMLQGMDQGRILYLVNGRRIAGRTSQRLRGATIPAGDVERIEIVRGPQSALYGSESIGGVINIITKKPQETFSLSTSLQNRFLFAYDDPKTSAKPDPFDDFDPLREQDATVTTGFSIGPLRNLLTLEGSRRAFYYGEDEDVSILPEYYQGGGSLDTAIPLGDTSELRFGASFMQMQTGDWSRNSRTKNLSLAQNEYLRTGGYVEMDFMPLENTNLTVKLYDTFYQRDNDAYEKRTDTWTTGKKHENENLAVLDAQAVYEGLPNFLFTGGLEVAYNTMEHFEFTDTAAIDKEAIFFQAEWFREDKYSLLGGVRVERNSQFGFMAAPKLSGMYYFFDGFRVLGGAGMGYRAPAFNELYRDYTNTGSDPYHIIPTLDLDPEYSASFNIGAEYSNQWGFLQLNGYYTELFNEIDTNNNTGLVDPDGVRIDKRENIARSLRTGVDTEGRLNFLQYFFVSAGYSWIYAYDRTRDTEKHDQPAHTIKAKAGFNYKSRERKMTMLNTYFQGRFFSLRGDGRYDADEDPRFILDFYFNIGLGKHFIVHTSVDNLLGDIYYYGPKIGQTVTMGLTYTL
ncbi:putative outer membrane protein [Treponema primitia ZAS-2]|uniref:Putative outer membrane protein n=1 Tax=Treponema primitia (strain ATCC BAA-887 / DSM 12427 / ZAS-2) TaxID=545694 RepID=F5YLC3_TREPZ|nr:TonB-dependent receptor [Treponema primitia]AEF84757.1 putative outer membrane protein [Treponema primitia ZAS-2]